MYKKIRNFSVNTQIFKSERDKPL